MKVKKRVLAFLLMLTMVLTFMPAIAFAEDGQNTKTATELTYKGSLEYKPAGVYENGDAYEADFVGWDEPGNEVIITWDDKTTSKFVCKEYEVTDKYGKGTAVGYFPEDVAPHIVQTEYGTDADNNVYIDRKVDNSGKITITYGYDRFYKDEDGDLQSEWKEISTTLQGVIASAKWALSAPDMMWAGDQGYWVEVFDERAEDTWAEVTGAKSDNTAVIVAKKNYYYDEKGVKHPFYALSAKKTGNATISVSYKAPNGDTGTLTKSINVRKYPNEIKSLKVDGKTVKISKNKYGYSKKVGKNKKSVKIKMALKSGWKIDSIDAYKHTKSGKSAKMKVTSKMLKKGSAIKFEKKYQSGYVTVYLKNGNDEIHYTVSFYR